MPILCPPIETNEKVSSPNNNNNNSNRNNKKSMLSQELRESFETVQAIHRVQLSFDSNHTNDHHHHHEHHDHYDRYDETIESFPHIKLDDNDQVSVPSLQHGLGERHASASSHFYHNVNYDPSSITSSNNANTTTTIMTEADVKAWKFEAALKAAMVAEAEISQLTNGIAELEELLLQKESCRSTRTNNNGGGGGGGGGGHGNEQLVDANNELEHHGTLFPSLPPCVMFCDTNSESKNEECNVGDDDDGHNMAYSS